MCRCCLENSFTSPFKEKKKYEDRRGCFNNHTFKNPDYYIVNDLIEMEYWNNNVGIITVKGTPLIKF